jgi:hypothetical protein
MLTTALDPTATFPSIPGDQLAAVHGGVVKITKDDQASRGDTPAKDDDSLDQLTGVAGSLLGESLGGPLGAAIGSPVGKLAGDVLGGLGSLLGL